jgi:hypothetical protein
MDVTIRTIIDMQRDNASSDEIITELKKQYPWVFTISNIEDAWRIDCAAYGPDNVNPYWRHAYGYPGGTGSIHVHNNTVIRVTKSAYFTFDYKVVVTPEQYAWALAHCDMHHAEFNERFFEAFPGPCDFETKRQIDRICGHTGYGYNGSAFTGEVGELCFRPARAASDDYDEIPAAFYRITARGLLTCSVDEVPVDSPWTWDSEMWYAYLLNTTGFPPSAEVRATIDAMVTRLAPQIPQMDTLLISLQIPPMDMCISPAVPSP